MAPASSHRRDNTAIMTGPSDIQTSKFLSLVLRHQPQKIGLALDTQGWAKVDELLEKLAACGHSLSLERLRRIVETNDKSRFRFSEDGLCIRASQGHSIAVDLELEPRRPPEILFHGTAERLLSAIRQKGLLPGTRQFVHLSGDHETAVRVGQRHGKPMVLKVQAEAMDKSGFSFFLSDNGVWLTKTVPVEFLSFPAGCKPGGEG